MAERKTAKRKTHKALTDEEQAAMRELVRERKPARSGKVDGEADVLAKIAEMAEPDRDKAERLHALIKEVAPELVPRTWYGMPAYTKGGKVVCFFQSAQKFKSRYATLGFSDNAKLDDGDLWPVAFALRRLTAAEEKKIAALLERAVAD